MKVNGCPTLREERRCYFDYGILGSETNEIYIYVSIQFEFLIICIHFHYILDDNY